MRNQATAIAAAVIALSLGTAPTTSFAHGADSGQGQMNGQGQAKTTTGQSQMGAMIGKQGTMMGKQGAMMGTMMGTMMGKQGAMMGQQGHMGSMMGGWSGEPLDLSADDVRKIIEGRMAWHGNDRLKVGKVKTVDDNTIVAEIVTVDDSLVMKMEFDRKTGAHHPVK